MKAGDVMTRKVVSIRPVASIAEMAKLMLENRISGLPVVDDRGDLVGVVTEGDCLRRAETGTERSPARGSGHRSNAGRAGLRRATSPVRSSVSFRQGQPPKQQPFDATEGHSLGKFAL